MAKGWESKAVEDQVQETQEIQQGQKSPKDNRKKQLTPEQMESRRRRAVLLLSRARVEKDLNASQNVRYREQLTKALSDLDAQISALEE